MNSAATQIIRVVIIDDHLMFREGLMRMLEREADLRVVGQFDSGSGAIGSIEAGEIDVILLDVDLGPERALEFVLLARQKGFQGRILIVTAGTTDQEALQLVQAGVAGILHKQNSTEVLCSTIRQVAQGGVHLEKDYLASLFRSVDRSRPTRPSKLTERDKTVLRYILQGLSNREIADRIGISEAAVKASLRQVFGKLNVRTRAQAVKVALEQYRDHL